MGAAVHDPLAHIQGHDLSIPHIASHIDHPDDHGNAQPLGNDGGMALAPRFLGDQTPRSTNGLELGGTRLGPHQNLPRFEAGGLFG